MNAPMYGMYPPTNVTIARVGTIGRPIASAANATTPATTADTIVRPR